MASPNFPITVPDEQVAKITPGDQQMKDDRYGFTESHRRAPIVSESLQEPPSMNEWEDGPLVKEDGTPLV